MHAGTHQGFFPIVVWVEQNSKLNSRVESNIERTANTIFCVYHLGRGRVERGRVERGRYEGGKREGRGQEEGGKRVGRGREEEGTEEAREEGGLGE